MLSHEPRSYLSAIIAQLMQANMRSLNCHRVLAIAHLGEQLRIGQSLTFIPLGTAINRVP
jgi:hypothetical protein